MFTLNSKNSNLSLHIIYTKIKALPGRFYTDAAKPYFYILHVFFDYLHIVF